MSRIETIAEGVTLYLGDCREILPTLGKVDAVMTDPPYRVTSGGFGELEGGFSGWIKDSYDNKGAIVTCNLSWDDWFPVVSTSLRAPGHAYIFCNDRNLSEARGAAERAGLEFHRLLVWDKKTALPNRWYIQNCEFVLFMRKGKAFQINDCGTMALQSIFQRDQSEHPTEKPAPLMELYIRNSTSLGQVVCDPFMGSGTTGVAAAKLRRGFVGIEIEQRWFDVACSRIAEAAKHQDLFTEEKPASQVTFAEIWEKPFYPDAAE